MDFATSLAMSVSTLTVAGAEVEIHQSRNSCFVDMNRNTLIAEFLKTDCTHIWFIDDDMGWNVEAIFAMLRADKEFIAGVGPKKVDSGNEFCCQINVHADETPMVEDGLISASRVGGAFVLMKRAAIQRMIDGYPELVCKAVDLEYGYRFYETEYWSHSFKTEDYNFCDRYTATGGEIWIYPNIDFIHTGVKDYKGNYHNFMMGMPKVAEKMEPEGLKYSIIMVTYKGEDALAKCLSSLIDHAPASAELIIIDNSPEPIEFQSIKPFLDRKYGDVLIQWTGVNYGFAEACNIGAAFAKGRNLIFINPDTMVFDGWATGLASHLRDGVGAVGPLSNFVSGLQNYVVYAHSTAPETETDWKAIASRIGGARIHKGIEAKLLIGFCLMVPRETWDTVGKFDPALKLGCDDLDYSLRLQNAGLKLIIAPDVFVYHEGHVSFKAGGGEAAALHAESEAAMRAKLKIIYGDAIPTSTELWGIEIFPTVELLPLPDEMAVIGELDLINKLIQGLEDKGMALVEKAFETNTQRDTL